jgi:hypothetical protein
MNRVKSIIDSIVVEYQEDIIIKNLRELGFTVTRNESTDEDGTYTVEKDGQVAILDLSSDEDLHDSLRSIQAAFGLNMDMDDKGFPSMNQKSSDHGLAQRVASIGEGRPGLWDNIRKKKARMGKNYRPAKPGEKGRPDPAAFKRASAS